MATVFVPPALRKHTAGLAIVVVPGETLRQLIDNLEEGYPGTKEELVDPDDGERLRPGLAAVVDGESVVLGLRQPLEDDSEVHFMPAMSGGGLPPST